MKLPTRFGSFGGVYVPEALVPALEQLEDAFIDAGGDPNFWLELDGLSRDYVGRPTPLTEASRLSERLGGVRLLLKREDLNHTGAHKINNTVGQALLARRMGKTRLIAETGAGQHGVATATVAAKFGFECCVYMGSEDVRRQALNVYRMELLGTEVRPVESGSRTLKDATNEALRDWVASVESTHYIIGSVVGPHPFPTIVRRFQHIIGDEARSQCRELTGSDPDVVVACVGGGSNAIGAFGAFVDDPSCTSRLVGIEAAGDGIESGRHGASIGRGVPGILHGSMSLVLQDEFGQVTEAHSISAGLDYPGVGPEHAALSASGRATYESATDDEALAALALLAESEGILCALETAHALAWVVRNADRVRGETVLLCLSGRGDKDVGTLIDRRVQGGSGVHGRSKADRTPQPRKAAGPLVSRPGE